MAKKTQRPELGQWLEIRASLAPRREYLHGITRKIWGEIEHKAIIGMYIGWSVVHDGEIEYMGEDIGNVFIHKKSHIVWKFITGEHKKPIKVLPFDFSVMRLERKTDGNV